MTKLESFRLISVKLGLTTSIQRSIPYLYNRCKELLDRFLCAYLFGVFQDCRRNLFIVSLSFNAENVNMKQVE